PVVNRFTGGSRQNLVVFLRYNTPHGVECVQGYGGPDLPGICGRRHHSPDPAPGRSPRFACPFFGGAESPHRHPNHPPPPVYPGGLIAMLGCSAAYNVLQGSRRRDLLRRLDQSAIFLMIAGTYTPFTTLCLKGTWAIGLTALVWSGAAVGIAFKMLAARALD